MDWFDPNMPNLRMFLIKVIGLAGIVALWLFGALLMRAFLRHEVPASESNRALGVERPHGELSLGGRNDTNAKGRT